MEKERLRGKSKKADSAHPEKGNFWMVLSDFDELSRVAVSQFFVSNSFS